MSRPPMPAAGERRVRDVLTTAEIAELRRGSDARGWLALVTTWSIIAACFALVAWRPTVLTITVALVLLGGRMLALAVLTHEAAHRSLFATRWLNDVVGHWLCGAPSWNRLHAYREHHIGHHAHAGSERDPDRALVAPFPCTRASLLRKLARDAFGWTGVRRAAGLFLMDCGYFVYDVAGSPRRTPPAQRTGMLEAWARNASPTLLANAALFGVLAAFGRPELYLLWVAAWLTSYSVVLRVRAIAEHACTTEHPNVFLNTRTVLVGPVARLLLAPHNVNYHLEHHLLPTVPQHALPRMSRMLRQRGGYRGAHILRGYWQVLLATTR